MHASDAYELIRFLGQFASRLDHAASTLESQHGMAQEKKWLQAAQKLLEPLKAEAASALEEALALPELDDARTDAQQQHRTAWVDGLEKLLAGITFHVGRRAPIVEALFPHTKLAPLARKESSAREYATELGRRLKTGYVVRMLGQEDMAFARPVLEQVQSAQERWMACAQTPRTDEETAQAIRQRLDSLASRIELPAKQARLLAEAALAPLPNAFHQAGLDARPKKRAGPSAPSEDTGAPAEAKPPESKTADEPSESPKRSSRRKTTATSNGARPTPSVRN